MSDGKGGRLKTGKTAVTAFTALALQQVASLAVTLLAARFLIPAEYGVYTLAIAFVTLLQTLTYAGIFQYTVTQKGDEDSLLPTSFWLTLGMALIGALILVAAARPLAWLFDSPPFERTLQWLAFVQPVGAGVAWCSAVLMRQKRFNLHYRILIAQNLIAMAGGIALILWLQSVWALVAFRYLRVAVGGALYFAFTGLRLAFRFDRAMARHAVTYSLGMYGTQILKFLSDYGADLVLGAFFGTREAGLYRFASQIAQAATNVVVQPMQSFALAQFGAANREGAPLSPLLARFAGTIAILVGCVAVLVCVSSELVVNTLFNPAYGAAVPLIYIIAARVLLNQGNLLVEPVLGAIGHTWSVMLHFTLWSGIGIMAVFATAPLGLTPLALSQAIAAGIASAFGLRLMRRKAGVELAPTVRALAKAVALLAAFFGLAWLGWRGITAEIPGAYLGLSAGIAFLLLFSLALLALAAKVRVLAPRVFSEQ